MNHPGLDLRISTGSTIPIYRQIMDGIRSGVASGELTVGTRLPSVRSLAEKLVVNHNTVAKAYGELVRDGVIESHQGRGVFVAQRRQIYTKKERTRRLARAVDVLVSEAWALDFGRDEVLAAVRSKLEELVQENDSSDLRGSR